jgi:hypothetical protein
MGFHSAFEETGLCTQDTRDAGTVIEPLADRLNL